MSFVGEHGKWTASQLRELVQPPPEVQVLVEEVAELVVSYGTNVEYQLRNREDGRLRYPFLFLDNIHSPYYHWKLKEARDRLHNPTTPTINKTRQQEVFDSEMGGETSGVPADETRQTSVSCTDSNDTVRLHSTNHCKTNSRCSALPEDAIKQNENASSQYSQSNHDSQTTVSSPLNIEMPHHQTQQRTSSSPLLTSSASPSPLQQGTSQSGIIPFGLLQEVHLLDAQGNDMSPFTSYIVIDNSINHPRPARTASNEDLLLHHVMHSPTPHPKGIEPIYRLRPNTSTIYRAPHSMLLSVGFSMGLEVVMRETVSTEGDRAGSGEIEECPLVRAVVIKRTVVCGKRVYDVKDEEGLVWEEVAEENLLPLEAAEGGGGTFAFRMPHKLNERDMGV